MNVGDKVKVHADGTSVFTIVNIDGDEALIESVLEGAPGTYPFATKLAYLVPAKA